MGYDEKMPYMRLYKPAQCYPAPEEIYRQQFTGSTIPHCKRSLKYSLQNVQVDGSDDNDDLKRKKREAMDGKMENKAVGEEETAFAGFF